MSSYTVKVRRCQFVCGFRAKLAAFLTHSRCTNTFSKKLTEFLDPKNPPNPQKQPAFFNFDVFLGLIFVKKHGFFILSRAEVQI